MHFVDSGNYAWNIYALPYLISGLLVLGLGIFVFSKKPKSPVHFSFFAVSLAVSVWLLAIGFMYCARNIGSAQIWNQIVWSAVSFISTNVYLFAVAFLGKIRRRKRSLLIGYSLSLLFAVLHLNETFFTGWMISGWNTYYWSFFPQWGPIYPIFMTFFVVYMAASFIELIHAHREENLSDRRVQIRWILLAFLMAYLGSVDFLPNFGYEVYTVGFLPILIWMTIMAYAIIRHRLMEIQTVAHKTAVWVALSSLVFIPFYAIFKLNRAWLERLPTWGISFFALGLFYLTTLYYQTVQPRIDQLFDRRKYDLRKAMAECIGDLAVLQELQPLAARILDRLCQVLTVQGGVAMVVDRRREGLILAARKEFDTVHSIAIDPALLQRLETGSMLEADQTEERPGTEPGPQAWLRTHSLALCLPLLQKGELIGMFAFGRKRNLRRFSSQERTFLAQIAPAVTIAFSNSLLLERVRELDRLKTEFLSEVAHELRGPLSGMSSIAEGILMLNIEGTHEDQRRMVENIRVTAVEMKELVDNILDLSKIEMGVMAYDFRPVDVGAVIRLAVELAKGILSAKGLEMIVEIEDALPVIKGDKARIRQCISNLLSNAVKYTDRGTIRITCRPEMDGIGVTVEDTGRGMTPEEVQSVFERFRRGSRVGTIEGSGLGLTLTKGIIEAHGGKIEVESTEGIGSRFLVFFPGVPPEPLTRSVPLVRFRPLGKPMTVSPSERNLISRRCDIEMGRGETLAVIDDSETERVTMRALLEARGYHVVTAADGLDGLELVRATLPQLVITDLIMPKMSGPELCALLRGDSRTASIPIIMVTGRNNLGDMLFGIEMGADDYLAKPYHIQELSVRISALLRMQRIRNALERERQYSGELEKKHHQVNSILQNKNSLIMQLAHEVKTPLTSLTSMIDNLNDEVVGPLSARQKEYLADIGGAAGRIRRLLTDLLCFAMAEAGTLRLQPREIQIGDLVRQVLTEAGTIQGTDRVTCRAGESLHEKKAFADPDRVQQILLNLIHNAVNASAPGSGVFIDAREEEVEVVVRISDSGRGIPQREISKLLQEPVPSGKPQGSGFGLFITRYLVELQGGRIWFESTEGRGTTFYFTLPKVNPSIQEREEHVGSDSHC